MQKACRSNINLRQQVVSFNIVGAAVTDSESSLSLVPGPLQVLVYHDLLGMMSHPHHAKVTPKFCKRYAEVGHIIQDALSSYRQDVAERIFPGQQFSPYSIQQAEVDALVQQLEESGMSDCAVAVKEAAAAAAAAKYGLK